MNRAEKLWRDSVFAGSFLWRLVVDRLVDESRTGSRTDSGSSVAILGGELFNKGAQAMTFTVADQLRRRHPGLEPVLLSARDYERGSSKRRRYAFEILPWGTEVRTRLLAPALSRVLPTRWPHPALQRVRTVLDDCRWIVDISGFALSAEFGFRTSLSYLSNLAVARRFGTPVYLLPQSFGPFDYRWMDRAALEPFLRTYLPYPELIFARERAGKELLARYTSDNLEQAPDLVLQHETYRLEHLYRSPPKLRRPEITAKGVGVVPNMQVARRAEPQVLHAAYEAMIEAVLDQNGVVYVFRHSTEDLELCRKIKGLFPNDERVVLLEEDFSAVELKELIGRLQFLIASRYHSVVHAYRNRVPAVVIGWAVKYRELAEAFDQTAYAFDGRDGLQPDRLVEAVRSLVRRREVESSKIADRLESIRRRPVLERLS